MKVTILYDNAVYNKDLELNWGFSVLIEKEGAPKVLFDTGSSGKILLNNMRKLSVSPNRVFSSKDGGYIKSCFSIW
ncbi:hypothetical protein [Petrotoga sp. 9PWA.NaAc.5.4]|uniref:hypothetical protein n=1 Tax=Petrotoga sp. 9PWA.NaAc.5.4 TaxID=1434328 RepID=UPI000CC2C09B|nr:hypothetical protein [Petrotoga sp. 9PWA.NaAc.5.4]PNR95383.1 hypothetical protein X924_04655 [Petrotoga sp. 9PWA.NaAc.5.4]